MGDCKANKKSQPVSWYKWEIVKQGGYARLTKVKKDGTFEELVDALVRDLEAFSCHLFNAKWHRKALQFVEEKNINDDADMKVLYNAASMLKQAINESKLQCLNSSLSHLSEEHLPKELNIFRWLQQGPNTTLSNDAKSSDYAVLQETCVVTARK